MKQSSHVQNMTFLYMFILREIIHGYMCCNVFGFDMKSKHLPSIMNRGNPRILDSFVLEYDTDVNTLKRL